MINWLLNLANSQAGKIGKFIGIPESEVKGAIEQGKKLLPEINNMDDGIRTFKKLGMSPQFVDGFYKRYSGYIDKIPGMNKSEVERYYQAIRNGLQDTPNSKESTIKAKPDVKKYPKV